MVASPASEIRKTEGSQANRLVVLESSQSVCVRARAVSADAPLVGDGALQFLVLVVQLQLGLSLEEVARRAVTRHEARLTGDKRVCVGSLAVSARGYVRLPSIEDEQSEGWIMSSTLPSEPG